MHKFKVTLPDVVIDNSKPALYKVHFKDRYYLHKGKVFGESVERLLDDIFRGMRGKKVPDCYSNVVDHCNKYPSLYKVEVELVLNDSPDKILRKETVLYKAMKTDPASLNRLDIAPYKPEWMIKQSLQSRCEECITTGVINDKKTKFKFCPNCGRLNK